MKKLTTAIILSSVISAPVFAGAYVETRTAYNTASDLNEVILRGGYNFDMGAGLMFTNAYNVGKWDEIKHSYNEIEGWYPLFKPTDKLTIQPGGLINDNRDGSGGAAYLDINYKFTPTFNLTFRYRYNHSNYDTMDLNGDMNKNDTHELANYWNFKVTDALSYTFEPHLFLRVNDFNSKNDKDHHWEITNKFSYKVDQNWMPYLELQWLDRWNYYNSEQYRIRLGVRYSF
ncbi:porin OmpL [Budvicia aquatica]|uniref:porin OmpL n=1 Tax=Budvicia aquatica TaxID=82979 RepID=A0A2C6DGM8_9GAMM|nr:porin OmpL [Budvicia aquatica]PHI29448.1 porin OmpL [Budvicia aquatica]VFS47729.1 Porin ompL precursor [Budvicia aquatica]